MAKSRLSEELQNQVLAYLRGVSADQFNRQVYRVARKGKLMTEHILILAEIRRQEEEKSS